MSTVTDRALAVLDQHDPATAAELRKTLAEVTRLLQAQHQRALVAHGNQAERWVQDSKAVVKDGQIQGYDFTRYVLIPVADMPGYNTIIDALTEGNAGLISDGPRTILSMADRMDRAVELLSTTPLEVPAPEATAATMIR